MSVDGLWLDFQFCIWIHWAILWSTFPLNHCLQSFMFGSSVSHDIVLNYVSPNEHWIISIDKFKVKWHLLHAQKLKYSGYLWLKNPKFFRFKLSNPFLYSPSELQTLKCSTFEDKTNNQLFYILAFVTKWVNLTKKTCKLLYSIPVNLTNCHFRKTIWKKNNKDKEFIIRMALFMQQLGSYATIYCRIWRGW